MRKIIMSGLCFILGGIVTGAIVGMLTGLFMPFHDSKKELKDPVETIRIESTDSKLMMVAMHCHTLEQEIDVLRLRIEELEEVAIPAITNKPVVEKKEIEMPLAIDDLIDEPFNEPCWQYYIYCSMTNSFKGGE